MNYKYNPDIPDIVSYIGLLLFGILFQLTYGGMWFIPIFILIVIKALFSIFKLLPNLVYLKTGNNEIKVLRTVFIIPVYKTITGDEITGIEVKKPNTVVLYLKGNNKLTIDSDRVSGLDLNSMYNLIVMTLLNP